MFSFGSIYKAYKDCRKSKRNTINQLQFEADLLTNLWDLHDKLNNKTYKIGKSICFLTSSPKLREVFAADFKDRVVHHILIKQIENFYENFFIYDVYNNRKNKGIHTAIRRAQKFMRQNPNGYYLQIDIKGFFYNLDKNILFKQFFKDIQNSSTNSFPSSRLGTHINDTIKNILWLANKIIYHNPTRDYIFKGNEKLLELLPPHKTLFKLPSHLGLPIGNLTSQFFANVYMNKFDHFVKRELKIKHYIRYVDDAVLFHKDKEKLKVIKEKIELFLKNNLALTLRADTRLRKHKDGLDFLGYITRPHYILTRKRVVNNYKYKKAKYLDKYERLNGTMQLEEIKKFLAIKASFIGHIKHSNSYRLQQKVGVFDDEKYIDMVRSS